VEKILYQDEPSAPADLVHDPVEVYLDSLAPASRRTMRLALRTVAALLASGADEVTLSWERVDYAAAVRLRSNLAARYAPSTANRMIAGFRGTMRAAFQLGLIDAERVGRACGVKAVRGTREPAGRALSPADVSGLVAACDSATTRGLRNRALLVLLCGCGLRRSEVAGLQLVDLDLASGTLVVTGKGNRQRRAFLSEAACATVRQWLALRGEAPGPLLCPIDKANHVRLKAMHPQSIYDVLREIGRDAGLADLSPHDARRGFVTTLLLRGADVLVVQRLAGHASVSTTMRYDRRGDDAMRKAAAVMGDLFDHAA
jgi:site-specific recombinase XerD